MGRSKIFLRITLLKKEMKKSTFVLKNIKFEETDNNQSASFAIEKVLKYRPFLGD